MRRAVERFLEDPLAEEILKGNLVEGEPVQVSAADGKVVSGPAPKALAWYHLTVSTDDGQLVADLANEVGRDFRLTVA